MTDNRLKSLADRIERLMDERDGLASDIRDIFTEAKSAGYVPKVLRKAIMRKRMDASKRDEEDAILELYEGALGAVGKAVAAVRAGSTWKEASEEHDVPRATLARAIKAVSKQRNDTAAEITTAGLDTPPVGSSELSEGHSSAAPDSDATEAPTKHPRLNALLAKARNHVMTPEEIAAQRASWVRGEAAMGDDADEREYRRRMAAGEPLFDTPSGAPPDTTSAALHGIEDSFPPSADPQTEGARPSSSPALSVGIEAGPIHDDALDIPPHLDRKQRASA